MEETTKLLLSIPKDVDYKLNLHLAEYKRMNIKITKADLIIKLMDIGLLQEIRIMQEK
jgi:hypothetical protein